LNGIVYYSPGDRGPYNDLEDAVADVPPGGTLQLDEARYAYGEEGRIAPDHAITVRGSGWTHGGHWFSNLQEQGRDGERVLRGTELIDVNSESSEPLIDFSKDPGGHRPVVRDLAVIGSRSAPYSVRFDGEYVRPAMMDCFVNGIGNGENALYMGGNAYFARIHRNYVVGGDQYAVLCETVGWAHEFIGNHFAGGLDCRVARPIIMGGQLGGTEGNPALRRYNPGGKTGKFAFVFKTGIEGRHEPASIVVDGVDAANPYRGAQIFATGLPSSEGKSGVYFGNAADCTLLYSGTGEEVVHWSENAKNCGVVTTAQNWSGATVRDDGATNPWVSVQGGARKSHLATMTDAVPTTVEYSVPHGSGIVLDDGKWYKTAQESISRPSKPVHYRLRRGAPSTIDGDLSDFPTANRLVLGEDTKLVNYRGNRGQSERTAKMKPDIDGEVRLGWDQDYLYVGGRIEDDVHTQDLSSGARRFRDSIQVGIGSSDARGANFERFILLITDGGEQQIQQREGGRGGENRGPLDPETAPRSITRDDSAQETWYEAALPWANTDVDPSAGKVCKLALMILDVDETIDIDKPWQNNQYGWHQWGHHLQVTSNADKFNRVELTD
jgi:hypothetical protein